MEMSNVSEQHEKAMADLGEQFKSKLIVEYQKFDNLDDMYNALKVGYIFFIFWLWKVLHIIAFHFDSLNVETAFHKNYAMTKVCS